MHNPGITLLIGLCVNYAAAGEPLELDDSFPDRKGDKDWLVMFYAPWCGHCRKLEPIWHQVFIEFDRELEYGKNSKLGINVAKLDATKYGSVASMYEVQGYPSIKYISGDTVFSHRGERSRDSIITWARRCHGPPVRNLSNYGKFNEIRSEHSDEVFFLHLGEDSASNSLLKKFKDVAEKYLQLGYFYSGEKKILPQEITVKHEPTILVFKDGQQIEFDPHEDGWSMESLDKFVNGERYQAFPKLTGPALNEMVNLNKRVVIVVTNHDKDKEHPHYARFKDMAKVLATQHRDQFHKNFQFIWMGEPDTANTITMSRPKIPYLVILDPNTQHYYLPEKGFDVSDMTLDDFSTFLHQVNDGKLLAHGGTGFVQRIKRFLFDMWSTVYGIWQQSPWLALLIFGVPTLVVSVVCYALCCMEPFDEEAFYEELAEEARHKQEEEEASGQGELSAGEEGVTVPPDVDADGHIKKE